MSTDPQFGGQPTATAGEEPTATPGEEPTATAGAEPTATASGKDTVSDAVIESRYRAGLATPRREHPAACRPTASVAGTVRGDRPRTPRSPAALAESSGGRERITPDHCLHDR